MRLEWWRHVTFQNVPLAPVKEKLTADPDSEIATTSLRVSLICPVISHSSETQSTLSTSYGGNASLSLAVGQDAPYRALSGRHLLPPAVLRRRPLSADEREEAHVDLSRLWQEGGLWEPHYRRVGGTSFFSFMFFLDFSLLWLLNKIKKD